MISIIPEKNLTMSLLAGSAIIGCSEGFVVTALEKKDLSPQTAKSISIAGCILGMSVGAYLAYRLDAKSYPLFGGLLPSGKSMILRILSNPPIQVALTLGLAHIQVKQGLKQLLAETPTTD